MCVKMHGPTNPKFTKYCSGVQIEKNEMGMECSTYGGKDRRIRGFGGGT